MKTAPNKQREAVWNQLVSKMMEIEDSKRNEEKILHEMFRFVKDKKNIKIILPKDEDFFHLLESKQTL